MKFFPNNSATPIAVPVASNGVECGFPSPADDHTDLNLDLNAHIVTDPPATFFVRANGDSLNGIGIYHGDLLVVSRSAPRRDGSVVVVALDGQLACKILDVRHRCFRAGSADIAPIPIPEDMDVIIEGVVTHAVHYLST